uniref:Uncharacterized protein n=1 Tax=Rhodopseudomonas palustris (strain BisA53) TaxID=316055 RepID=Q07QK4_RHOP5
MAQAENDFDAFVRRQQEIAAEAAAEDQTPFDPAKELKEWLDRLAALFSQIDEFLKEYVTIGSIKTERGEIKIAEEFSGPYIAPKMTIRIGLEEIKLVPIGTMLIGSKGRVDIVGRAGSSRLVLVNKRGSRPSPAPKKPADEPVEWVWKIASRPPVMTLVDFNKETFFQILLEVSNA